LRLSKEVSLLSIKDVAETVQRSRSIVFLYYCLSGLHARLRSLDHAQAIAFIQLGMVSPAPLRGSPVAHGGDPQDRAGSPCAG
jgi:hypothetical protein